MNHPWGDQHGCQILHQENERPPRGLTWMMQSECIRKQLIFMIMTIYTAIKTEKETKDERAE